MLKKFRLTLALLFFAFLTLLFLDFTGTLHLWLGWMAKIQLIPAVLAHSAVIILGIILFTLLFGRVYCSVICPLGTFQDGVSRLSKKRRKKRFRYARPSTWLRYGMLALFVVAMVAGVSVIVSLFDPYAAYGRMASNFLAPVYYWGNNLLAWYAERINSYAFYTTSVWLKSGITFGITAATFVIISILAWLNGRIYCNTVCPVGTFLGFFSRFSIFKVVLDREKCTRCGLCERQCKASCIDVENMRIDHSRCVGCFNCIGSCKSHSIKYTPLKREKTNKPELSDDSTGISRRKVLGVMALLATGSVVKVKAQMDGGVASIENKKIPERKTPLTPPGSQGAAHLKQHCTACQLCISACPNHVLRPSNKLATLMQPEMSYERGYCRPECTECSQVCPNNAIKRITTAEKSAISIGFAVWMKENCVVNTDHVPCTNCERHCPTGAITLVPRDPNQENSLKIPTIDKERCIGCGACENLCPARPFSAIYVEGNIRHHQI